MSTDSVSQVITPADPVQVVTNFPPNPSLETNTAEWAGVNSATLATSSASGVVVGSKSLQVTAAGPGVNNATGFTSSSDIRITDGNVPYTFSFYATTAVAGMKARINIVFMQGGSPVGTGSSTPVVIGASPTRVDLTASPSDIPDRVGLTCVFGGFAGGPDFAGGELFYADAVMITGGSTLLGYFDGDTPNDATYTYTWTGPAHGSASTKWRPL